MPEELIAEVAEVVVEAAEAKKPFVPFGEHIRDLREKAKLSITEAAVAAGMSSAQWSQMEEQNAVPTLRMLRPIAYALGKKPHEVL